jgi:hypothetical protein
MKLRIMLTKDNYADLNCNPFMSLRISIVNFSMLQEATLRFI